MRHNVNVYNGRQKRKSFCAILGWNDYASNVWRLYHDEKMSSQEIADYINQNMGKSLDRITSRSIQRTIVSYASKNGFSGTRSGSEAFRLAISKGRVRFALKEWKVKRKKLDKKLRYTVLLRDNFRCQLCGADARNTVLEVDHIKPIHSGQDDSIENLRTLCHECNHGRYLASPPTSKN